MSSDPRKLDLGMSLPVPQGEGIATFLDLIQDLSDATRSMKSSNIND